jgi:integrase
MASITTRKNGGRFITFRNAVGEPRHITLGKAPKRYAEAVKVKVEDLASASIHGHAPSDDTARWLASLDDRLYDKLAAVGLVATRQSTTIKGWLEQFLKEREGDLKPESLRKLRQTKTKLLAFFEADTPLREITPEDAVAWRRFLKELGLSEAAIKTHSGNAKTMLNTAVLRKVIAENPFILLKSGPTPSKYTRYVTPDEIERVIDACPNAEWRLLFGVARYAGLRIPSESHLLTWADVDFERGRLTVHSPKTERHEGHEQRVIPITPRLMELLQQRFDECDEGEERLITISGKGALIRRVRRIWARAGVEPWARLWQTLRQSCEKEWAMTFPQYAVSRWIGHSITVSGRHYANAVPEELLDRAAGIGDGAQRNAQLKAHETPRNGQKIEMEGAAQNGANSRVVASLRDISAQCESERKWSRGESNPRAGAVGATPLRV